MAEIRGEYLLMADSLVNKSYVEYVRREANVDISKLEGAWIPAEMFNRYIEIVRNRAGDIGPYLIGTRILGVANEILGSYKDVPDLQAGALATQKTFTDSNRGEDAGYYKIEAIEEHNATIITTSQLDEGFHLGVFVWLVRHYKSRMARGEIVENMAEHKRTVFKYTW